MVNRSDTPRFTFYLYNSSDKIQSKDPLWKSPLPVSRKSMAIDPVCRNAGSVTYGEYFSAARSFMEQTGIEMMERALFPDGCRYTGLTELGIIIEKHGEFYHPARIEAVMPDRTVSFVLNVAISTAGKKGLQREFTLIKRLRKAYHHRFLPEVYGWGEVRTPTGRRLGMLLGRWFEGFHEFHLSILPKGRPEGRRMGIRIWAPGSAGGEGTWLEKHQARQLYRQSAMILTCYYDVETREQIFPWHHAAGDFVLKLQHDAVELKLVTVRQYAAMVDTTQRDIQATFEALLVFFLNLTIRNRLDRLDGTGELAWADDIAIQGTIEGFFDALALKSVSVRLPAPLDECFKTYLLSREASDLTEYANAIVDSYPRESAEVPVIQEHLDQHLSVLYDKIHDALANTTHLQI
jgi:hypothetical protein